MGLREIVRKYLNKNGIEVDTVCDGNSACLAVDTHIKKLRAALGKASYHLETVIKVGYMWK